MIRAIRIAPMAQDDASLVTGWNVAPNVAYVLVLSPGSTACGVVLYAEDGVTAVASGAALVGTDQPCVLLPKAGQSIDMVDADLGWHLLLTTVGTESQRTIRIGPAVDLPDEIHPVYGDDDLALARATAAIDVAAHYIDDVTVTCPLGLGAGLGGVVSVPVDGVAVVGQVESVTWTGTPDGAIEQAVVRRHVAIAPEAFVEPVRPTIADDTGTTGHRSSLTGNVLANDDSGLAVNAVNGLAANVGQIVAGSNGGKFTINADGSWSFNPNLEFEALVGAETLDTSVTYHASDGAVESLAEATLTVTVFHENIAPVATDDDGGECHANDTVLGNVLTNDTDLEGATLYVSKVDGDAGNVGVPVAGSNGGLFTIASNGSWSFDPNGEFDDLEGEDSELTSISYHASDGSLEGSATLSVTVIPALPTVEFVTSYVSPTFSTASDQTLTLPAGIEPGDLVLVVVSRSSSGDVGVGVTAPTGYTEIVELFGNDTYDTNLSVSYKIMGDPVDTTVTVTGCYGGVSWGAGAIIMVWRGVDPTTPMDVAHTVATFANTIIPNPPPITPVTDGAVIVIVGATAGNTNGYITAAPAGQGFENFINGAFLSTSGGNDASAAVASLMWNSSMGTVGPGAFSATGNNTSCSAAAVTLALRPAS